MFLANSNTDKILLGKRKDSGLYGLPGGWLERYEDWEECAARELWEETGLQKSLSTFCHIYTLNSLMTGKNYHAISCIMYNEVTDEDIPKIKNTEPEKCEKWIWVTFKQLRNNIKYLFYPLQDFLRIYPKLDSVEYLKGMIKQKAKVIATTPLLLSKVPDDEINISRRSTVDEEELEICKALKLDKL